MRVISGIAKGRTLLAVPGDQTRPITDRVKESLFDIIGPDVIGSAWWDVFAGTGAVGIEALSRGAAFARFTDIGRAALETIKENLDRTRLSESAEVRRADAFSLIAGHADRSFEYVYVAPPQYKDMWKKALLAADASPGWLAADGWLVVQIDPKEYSSTAMARLEEFDQRRYGTTLLVFFRRA